MSEPPALPPLDSAPGAAFPGRWLPPAFFETAERVGVRFTRHALWVRIRTQQLFHCVAIRRDRAARRPRKHPDYVPWERCCCCSTSRFGIGQVAGSNCTPLGLHRIARKIGGGWPVGTVFKSRQPVGFTWKGMPFAPITTRILWLEGLEPGFNRGGNVDSFRRHIYIHGTGDEPTLGRPASHGCIHLAADDLIPLYDLLPVGTLVWIER